MKATKMRHDSVADMCRNRVRISEIFEQKEQGKDRLMIALIYTHHHHQIENQFDS